VVHSSTSLLNPSRLGQRTFQSPNASRVKCSCQAERWTMVQSSTSELNLSHFGR